MCQENQVPDRSELRSIDNELVEIYPRLCKYARSLRISKADAEDLIHDTCVRVLEHHEQFRPGTKGFGSVAFVLRASPGMPVKEFITNLCPSALYISEFPGLLAALELVDKNTD